MGIPSIGITSSWTFEVLRRVTRYHETRTSFVLGFRPKLTRHLKETFMFQPNGPEQLPPPALVMQMITGHWVSQLVGSLCRLGIPDALAEQPLTSAIIAKK